MHMINVKSTNEQIGIISKQYWSIVVTYKIQMMINGIKGFGKVEKHTDYDFFYL